MYGARFVENKKKKWVAVSEWNVNDTAWKKDMQNCTIAGYVWCIHSNFDISCHSHLLKTRYSLDVDHICELQPLTDYKTKVIDTVDLPKRKVIISQTLFVYYSFLQNKFTFNIIFLKSSLPFFHSHKLKCFLRFAKMIFGLRFLPLIWIVFDGIL